MEGDIKMKPLKSILTLFVALSFLFPVACSFKIDKLASVNEENTPDETVDGAETSFATIDKEDTSVAVTNEDSAIIDVTRLPLVVKSVEDLKLAIEQSRSRTTLDIDYDPAINLPSIDYFYVPTVEFENHELFQIEVLKYYIVYYYLPKDII